MKITWSRSASVVVASSSVVMLTWRILRWRARKRSKIASDRVARMVTDGPMIDCEDSLIQHRILDRAIRRASKWMAFTSSDAVPMVGQVGGVSIHKRPLLTLAPEYVLKPLHTDHRGIREVAFYEAIRAVSQNTSSQAYVAWVTGKKHGSSVNSATYNKKNNPNTGSGRSNNLSGAGANTGSTVASMGKQFIESWDIIAMWLAMSLQDPVVAEHEQILVRSKKCVKKEIEVLRKLANFTSKYYGVTRQKSPLASAPYGITTDAHLLLQDLTNNFSKPCVMDIKMGTQCYEPDAPEDKKLRELGKYPQQKQFGFRIVGMRIYDPLHPDANEMGFRQVQKEYGRSLATSDEVMDAFRIYLSAGCSSSASPADASTTTTSSTTNASTTTAADSDSAGQNHHRTKSFPKVPPMETIRTRSISNLLIHLQMIERLFDENKSLCFYSSSILMAYEGNINGGNPDVASVKMIDFGRVRRQFGGDPGYKLGLRTIRKMMDKLKNDEVRRLRSLQ